MAASMWRMNGLCRKMAGLLVLSTLLLSGAVICQEQASDSPDATAATGNVTVDSTAAFQNASVAPSVGGGQSNVNSGLGPSLTTITVNVIPEITASVNVIPEIIASDDAGDNVLPAEASSDVKTSKESTESPSSSDSSVFVGVLVSGLLAALGITAGYFYCQRRTDTKGIKLTDEAYPADQENQGSTLASVAPLNPPPETQEKPSVNGESPEAAKTQPPPPNNGHSTTKTADTEL